MSKDEELYAIIGETKKIRVKGTVWEISACSIAELPKLQNLMVEFEKIQIKDESELLSPNSQAIDIMAKIIKMGLIEKHPGINIEIIKEKFSLAALPAVITIIMDLNDFLSGMKGLKNRMM